jgi:hypothetical protein
MKGGSFGDLLADLTVLKQPLLPAHLNQAGQDIASFLLWTLYYSASGPHRLFTNVDLATTQLGMMWTTGPSCETRVVNAMLAKSTFAEAAFAGWALRPIIMDDVEKDYFPLYTKARNTWMAKYNDHISEGNHAFEISEAVVSILEDGGQEMVCLPDDPKLWPSVLRTPWDAS